MIQKNGRSALVTMAYLMSVLMSVPSVMVECMELKQSRWSLDVLRIFHCYDGNSLCNFTLTTIL